MADKEKKYQVTGMNCAACSRAVEKATAKVSGVEGVSVNLLTGCMNVSGEADPEAVIEAVTKAGYKAQIFGKTTQKVESSNEHYEKESKKMQKRIFYSAFFCIVLMILTMGPMIGISLPQFLTGHQNLVSNAFLQFLLTLPVVYLNRSYFQKGFKSLWQRHPNMDALVAVGAGASLVYGIFVIFRLSYALGTDNQVILELYAKQLYFDSAAMILTLITIGKYLESRAKGKTTAALESLMALKPSTALVKRGEEWVTLDLDALVVGDLIQIRPGDRIPVDGEVISGKSSVDESAITGESVPVQKNKGDFVTSATLNKTGQFVFKAQKVGSETTLSKIIALVEEANATKAPIARLADKIAGIFVPTVMAISFLTILVWLFLGYGFEFAFGNGISVLVISCPCALGLATPVAIMVGTGVGARNGVLFKSSEALEKLNDVEVVVFDKTGTLTKGAPEVTDVLPQSDIDSKELLRLLASLEKNSEHPLAEAILKETEKQGLNLYEVEDFRAFTGKGIAGTIEGKCYFSGNRALLKKFGLEPLTALIDKLAQEGKTPIYLFNEKEILGVVACADQEKSSASQAIARLHQVGKKLVMLTGDHQLTANAIGEKLNIDCVIAEVLPEEKEQVVRQLQENGKKVAMVGDGINDAPALASADVGIAIGGGTDVAMDTADVVLMTEDLKGLAKAIILSKATLKNIKQNLFWAFFYNALGIPLAAGIFYIPFGIRLNPMIGALAMSLSSLFVVTNALRLRRLTFSEESKDYSPSAMEDDFERFVEGDDNMKKIIDIEGMSCEHCSAAVTKALLALDGVEDVKVSLSKKQAVIKCSKDVADTAIKEAIEAKDFKVGLIKEKKGLFS